MRTPIHHFFALALLAPLVACNGAESAAEPQQADLPNPNRGESFITSNPASASRVQTFAEQASCVPNPVDDNPGCCAYGWVARPLQNMCTKANNLSPRIDLSGFYRGEADPNALHVGDNVLQICAVHVIDNGEGSGWPHGPYGNLYVDFFKPDEPLQYSPDNADERRIRAPRLLRGPHRTHGDTDEWLDDEALLYWKYGVFDFDAAGPTANQVVMRVWESDSKSEDGSWGRRNDVLGMELVDRASTSQAATWIAFHKYTNDHPRRRTDEVALRIRVKTGGTCPLDY